MENPEEIRQAEPRKRPEMLTVLCILTFIGSGLSAVMYFYLFLVIDPLKELLAEQSVFVLFGEEVDISFLLDVPSSFFLLEGLFYSLSVLGAVQMWKLNKAGFHFYAVSQIVLLVLPKLFIAGLPFPVGGLMLAAAFVFLYSRNLQFMK